MTRSIHTLASLSFALLSLESPIIGAADESLPTETVRLSDNDLHSTTGYKSIYSHIRHAADRVCGIVDERDLQGMASRKNCMDDAVARAVRQVNNQHLTEYVASLHDGPASLAITSNLRTDIAR